MAAEKFSPTSEHGWYRITFPYGDFTERKSEKFDNTQYRITVDVEGVGAGLHWYASSAQYEFLLWVAVKTGKLVKVNNKLSMPEGIAPKTRWTLRRDGEKTDTVWSVAISNSEIYTSTQMRIEKKAATAPAGELPFPQGDTDPPHRDDVPAVPRDPAPAAPTAQQPTNPQSSPTPSGSQPPSDDRPPAEAYDRDTAPANGNGLKRNQMILLESVAIALMADDVAQAAWGERGEEFRQAKGTGLAIDLAKRNYHPPQEQLDRALHLAKNALHLKE